MSGVEIRAFVPISANFLNPKTPANLEKKNESVPSTPEIPVVCATSIFSLFKSMSKQDYGCRVQYSLVGKKQR